MCTKWESAQSFARWREDHNRPDRWDTIDAIICLAGVALIMYAPAIS